MWDPETLQPTYIGVADFDSGEVTLVRDDGPEGIWVYEGKLMQVDAESGGSIDSWVGRCTNGDGSIKAVFSLTKSDER